MTVEAVLGRDYVARTLSLVQYDEGQKIHLSGIDLPASYLAEFSNCEYGTAPQITQTTDTITVPKEYLESGDPVHIWIVVTGPDERTTRYKIFVPVKQRGEPENYVPTPSEKTAIEAAIEALNEAVADSQVAITHYPRITDGMWDVWDVANQRWVSTFVKAEGEDGRSIIGAVLNEDYTLTITFSDNTTYTTPSIRGGEGFSPIATVVKEGRAATITITDQNGTTTAQVYDADPTTIIDDTAGIGATGKVWSADKSAASLAGKADLDVNGKVPSSQLPSYVDDVLEYADLAHFPAEGETGKIYVALDTNKTYRWGGSEYAEISASLALGETSSTAYAGDRGKIAYDHAVAKGISTAGEAIYKIATNSEGHVSSATAATLGDLTALGAAPKNSPEFASSISMGRRANTAVGSNSVAVGYDLTASGAQSHAEGCQTTASGMATHAEGYQTAASGYFAHAEGNSSTAQGDYSHAEGGSTLASDLYSHAEGQATQATGYTSHAEGSYSKATESYAHAEGSGTTASGNSAHTEGAGTTASGIQSHAEGAGSKAQGAQSHAEGAGTTASGSQAHAEGGGTTASGAQSHAEGSGTTASGAFSHAEGYSTQATEAYAHAEGGNTRATYVYTHAEGYDTKAQQVAAHAEGCSTTASANYSHSEGYGTTASGQNAHAEGSSTTASGYQSHAEGSGTIASGSNSHAEGGGTEASGVYSHAEGSSTMASANNAHAEGSITSASGFAAHSEGERTSAKAEAAHAEGYYTIAEASASHVEGKFNVADSYASWDEWTANTSYAVGDKVKRTVTVNGVTTVTGHICKTANSDASFTSSKWTTDNNLNYAHITGNGTADNARSNAYALDWDGNGHYKGDVYVGCNGDSTGGTKVAKITDIPTVPVQDVQVNGTSILNNGVANVPVATTSDVGVIKVGSGLSISDNTLRPIRASDAEIKSGTQSWNIIVPATQERAAFYGLAKAAGDSTQSASSNAVGTYTDEAKAAIQSMLDVPSVDDMSNKVDKTAIDNAGITSYTYNTKFGGEFSVTTATTSGWLNPYARASVTGRIDKTKLHRATINGTEYVLRTRLWYSAASNYDIKVYEYLGNIGLYISSTSGVPGGTDSVPFVIISDLDNSGSIDVLTSTAGTYSITVEEMTPTQKVLPKSLVWDDAYVPIEKNNNGGTYNGFSIGVNELTNTRATGAIGYGNKISSEFSYAIGTSNQISSGFSYAIGKSNQIIGLYDRKYAIGENNTVYSGTAIGRENTVNSGYAIGLKNDLSSGIGVGYGLKTNGPEVVLGFYNVMPNEIVYVNWQSNTEYHIGDHVLAKPVPQFPVPAQFLCLVDHTSSSAFSTDYRANKWIPTSETSDTRFLIGIGSNDGDRKNGLKIDTTGCSHFYNDIYVKCEADSTGGIKVATVNDIPTVPVQDVQVNGVSVLNQGVANVPVANDANPGVVKVSGTYGIDISVGTLIISCANSASVKAGSYAYKPITPACQHESTFYGLAKAAGDTTQSASSNAVGTYTESAKSAISQMLNAPETVSGSTPSITAKAGVRYVCGECATLSFTPSASGDCEVIFESGSTATVLTLPNTVKMPDWFDATNLEANRTYDIIITNGVYGVVTSWA